MYIDQCLAPTSSEKHPPAVEREEYKEKSDNVQRMKNSILNEMFPLTPLLGYTGNTEEEEAERLLEPVFSLTDLCYRKQVLKYKSVDENGRAYQNAGFPFP